MPAVYPDTAGVRNKFFIYWNAVDGAAGPSAVCWHKGGAQKLAGARSKAIVKSSQSQEQPRSRSQNQHRIDIRRAPKVPKQQTENKVRRQARSNRR